MSLRSQRLPSRGAATNEAAGLKLSSSRTQSRGSRGNEACSPRDIAERAAKPLGSALDSTLDTLMRQLVGDHLTRYDQMFADMEGKMSAQQEHIDQLSARILELEAGAGKDIQKLLDRHRQARIESQIRVVAGKMLRKGLLMCFSAWKLQWQASTRGAQTRRIRSVERQVEDLEDKLRERTQHTETDLKQLDSELQRVESMLGIKHEELHSAHTELFEKMHVWDPATETWVEKPAPKPMRPGLQHLENTLRNVIRRWQHHQLAAVFHNMRARARQLKRQRYVVTVAIGRINNKLIGKAFLGWRENAKAQHRGRANIIQKRDAEATGDREKMETVWKQVVGIQEASSNSNEEAKSLQEQIQEIKQLQMNGNLDTVDRLRLDLEERLEFLEVSLREEFQHVEVRCDIIGREFGRMQGKPWSAGGPLHSSSVESEKMANAAEIEKLQSAVQELKTDIEFAQTSAAEERSVLEKLQRDSAAVIELKARVDSLDISVVKSDTLSPLSNHLPDLKAQVHAFERELTALRQEHRAAADQGQETKTALAGVKATVHSLEQASAEIKRLSSATADELGKIGGSVQVLKSDVSTLHDDFDGLRGVREISQRAGAELATLKGQLISLQYVQEQSNSNTSSIAELKAKLNSLESDMLHGDREQSMELKSTVSRMQTEIKQMIEVANRNASRAIEDLQDTRRHTEEEITKVKAELMQDQIDDKLVEANLRSITEKMEVLQQLATSSMPAEMSPRVPAPPTTSSYFQSAPPASAQFEKGGQNLVMDELGTVTRRIATLKLELQILSEQDDPESAIRMDELEQELSDLQNALEQLLGQADNIIGGSDVIDAPPPPPYLSPVSGAPRRATSSTSRVTTTTSKNRLQTREEAWARAHSAANGR